LIKRWSLALLTALVFLVRPATSVAQTFDYSTGVRGTRLWVPPGLETVKGIVIYGNGAGGDFRDVVNVPWLQQFGSLHDFAVIGTSMWGNLSGTEINIWETHLAGLAAQSAHAELVHAPWAPMGFSNGGSMAYGFNALRPQKTIAFVANKGCCYNNRSPSTAALQTPGLLISGELDTLERHNSIKGLFDDNRPRRGALWAWAEQEGMAHEGFVDEIILPFMAEAIRLRYPAGQAPTATSGVNLLPLAEADGWLADQSTWKSGITQVASYADYAGNKRLAGWLLNERMAAVYRAFSTYDSPARLTFADAPLDPWPFGAFVGNEAPATLGLDLEIDLTSLADWTKIELLNYSTPVLTVTPGPMPAGTLHLEAPIPAPGVYGFSALVTHADGVTVSTSNVLAFTTVPEPDLVSLLTAIPLGLSRWRRGPTMA
jgi:hypothetical protein